MLPVVFGISTLAFVAGAPAPRPPVEGLALGVPVPGAELARPKFWTGAGAAFAAGAAVASGILAAGAGMDAGTGAVSAGLLFEMSIVISFWPRGALMLQNGLYVNR